MAKIYSNPLDDLRDIVAEHEANPEHTPCRCMERIGYIMQVFYPGDSVGYEIKGEDENE